MDSVIVRIAARALGPLLVVLALYLLAAGHDEPGGGFVAGLLLGSAFVLSAAAYGVGRARTDGPFDPRMWIGLGLLTALGSGLPGVIRGGPFLSGVWADGPIPVGTPLVFDLGVAIVVAHVVMLMTSGLLED
jgi:multisubunit Na+/H+ antiporter MnhB subunit